MSEITSLSAVEILDSRGKPTLLARCALADGSVGMASVPSGASTGAAEAHELRDGGDRYAGQGCLRAVAMVNSEINGALTGRRFENQAQLDEALIELDGSPNKSRLGSNAFLGVSLAFCRAQSAQAGLPLYRHLAHMADESPRLPRPMINLFSGGAHAGGQVAIQDVQLVVPEAQSIRQALEVTAAVYRAAAELLHKRYGMRLLTADEGGLAPPCQNSETMLSAAVDAIAAAGFVVGDEVALTLDVAATQFYADDRYQLDADALSREQMIAHLATWCREYPVVSLEDGLQQDDWAGWRQLMQRLGGQTMILGDDLLCTNPARIRRAIEENAADSLLLKVNQIGTLTEALAALKLARRAGWRVVISARSGETEDDWLADLAVGWAGDYIKVGSITQSERLAKYNRLLVLEQMDGLRL